MMSLLTPVTCSCSPSVSRHVLFTGWNPHAGSRSQAWRHMPALAHTQVPFWPHPRFIATSEGGIPARKFWALPPMSGLCLTHRTAMRNKDVNKSPWTVSVQRATDWFHWGWSPIRIMGSRISRLTSTDQGVLDFRDWTPSLSEPKILSWALTTQWHHLLSQPRAC